jgi:hypothetical protein
MTDHAAPSILSGQDGFYPKTQIKKVAVWIKTCFFYPIYSKQYTVSLKTMVGLVLWIRM